MSRITIAVVVVLGSFAVAAGAQAQIKRPGAHPRYDTEVEPHLFVQWTREPTWNDEGFGLGVRVTIPLAHNGPIDSINNSHGIGFGFDWAHFDDGCLGGNFVFRGDVVIRSDGCEANVFWLPVVWQWNFFFTELISALLEPGLALEYTDGLACENRGGPGWYCDDSDLDLEFVLWLGVRFHLGDDFALVLRLGTPSLDFGPAFFL